MGICGNNHKTDFPSFPAPTGNLIPAPLWRSCSMTDFSWLALAGRGISCSMVVAIDQVHDDFYHDVHLVGFALGNHQGEGD